MNTSDGPVYIECLMLDQESVEERAIRIGTAIVVPCKVAESGHEYMERLHFWRSLVAFVLGAAEHSIGTDGRMAIVQCMRNVPATAHQAPEVLQ